MFHYVEMDVQILLCYLENSVSMSWMDPVLIYVQFSTGRPIEVLNESIFIKNSELMGFFSRIRGSEADK